MLRVAVLRRRRYVVMVMVMCLVIAAGGAAAAWYNAVTSSAGNSVAAAASFNTYPQAVLQDTPRFYHRSEEGQSATATSAAADVSLNNRAGVFNGTMNGPKTWWKFDENTGTKAADSAGAANQATLTPTGASWASDRTGGSAVALDGTTGYYTATAPAIRTDTDYTVSAWVYLASKTSAGFAVSQGGDWQSAFGLEYYPSGDSWGVRTTAVDVNGGGASPARLSSGTKAAVAAWTHLAVVRNVAGNGLYLYVNGQLEAQSTSFTPAWNATGPLRSGLTRDGSVGFPFNGRVDDVRAYQRALSSTEVRALAEENNPQPVLQWRFEDSMTGSSIVDNSGRGNTGARNTSTFVAAGHRGQAMSFNGTTNYINPTGTAVDTRSSFTVAAWAKPSALGGNRAVAAMPGTLSSTFWLRANASTNWQLVMTNSDIAAPTTSIAASATAPVTGQWVHLAGIYDDARDMIHLYVNGDLVASTAKTVEWAAAPAGPFTVGRARNGSATSTDYFAGTVDDVRLYDTALDSSEIQAIYRAPTTGYDFEEGAGDTVQDLARTVNPGTAIPGTLSPATAGAAFGGAGTGWNSSNSLALDGVNDYVAGAGPAVRTNESFTVSAWVYLTAKGSNRTILSQDGTTLSGFYLQFLASSDRWVFTMLTPDSGTYTQYAVSSTAAPNLNQWYHLTGVYDAQAATIDLYVNGALHDTIATTGAWNATGNFTVGRGRWGGNPVDYYSGNIDTVRTFQTAFNAAHVWDNYNETPKVRYEFEEGAGTTTASSAGHGQAATSLTGGAAWTTAGYSGNAITYTAATSGRVTTSQVLDTTASFTVSAWAKVSDKTASRTVLSQDASVVSGLLLEYDSSSDRWAMGMYASDANGTPDRATSVASPALNTWYHLVGVYDDASDQLRLYVDGTLEGTTTHSTDFAATNNFAIGRTRYNSASARFFQGTIDSVAAYRRALSGNEVTRMYRGPQWVLPETSPMSGAIPGALQGAQQGQTGTTAVAYAGTTAQTVGSGGGYNNTADTTNPQVFTMECWFKADIGGVGGLMGFSSSKTALTGANSDRVLYLDADGRLTFGVYTGSIKTVRSTTTYTDATWHHVAASLGPAGLQLWVDAYLVDSDPNVTTAQNTNPGYWRFGALQLVGWPDRPSNDYFIGALDEISVTPAQLTMQQLYWHYFANH